MTNESYENYIKLIFDLKQEIEKEKLLKEKNVDVYIIKFPEIKLETEINSYEITVKAILKIENYKNFYAVNKLRIDFKDNQDVINEVKRNVIRSVLKQYNNDLLEKNGLYEDNLLWQIKRK